MLDQSGQGFAGFIIIEPSSRVEQGEIVVAHRADLKRIDGEAEGSAGSELV